MLVFTNDRYESMRRDRVAINPAYITSVYDSQKLDGIQFTVIEYCGNAGNPGYSHKRLYSLLPFETVLSMIDNATFRKEESQ